MTTTSNMPHSREAEEAVLGSVLINPEIYPTLGLTAKQFYLHRLGMIWAAFARLEQNKMPIDFLTVSEELNKQGQLEEIGGPAYLTALLNQVPTTLHAEGYAAIIKENAIRRDLLVAANEVARLAYDTKMPVEAILTAADVAMGQVGQSQSLEMTTMADVASDIYDKLAANQRLKAQGKKITPTTIATGLLDIDFLLNGGLDGSRLYIVAGRPGQGKSSLMLSIVRHSVITLKKRVGLFSLEMSNEQVGKRFVAQESGIQASKFTTEMLEPDDWEPFNSAVERIDCNGTLYMDDTPSISPAQLRAKCYQLQRKYGLDMLVLDYLQLMGVGGMRLHSREQEVAYCSRELKNIARELRIPVIAAAQLSRASEMRADHEPQLSDLRESGAIENDADVVGFIWRPDETSPISRCKIGKNRDGRTGYADLFFDVNLTQFKSAKTKVIDLNS